MNKHSMRFGKTLLAAALSLSAFTFAGCQAEGDLSGTGSSGGASGGSGSGGSGGSGSGGISSSGGSGSSSGGSSGGGVPNDGTTPTDILDGDNGTNLPGNFICTASARAYGNNPSTTVVVNGLVGSAVTDLLNMLGAGTVTNLQNSIVGKELAVDGQLDTAAIYSLTVGLLGGAISSIDLLVGLNGTAPIGRYAVFGVRFPTATVEASLVQSVTVRTFLGSTLQETANLDASTLDLLGQVSTGDAVRYVGMRVKKPYDGASITLNPTIVTANVGEAMYLHELCTDGYFVTAP